MLPDYRLIESVKQGCVNDLKEAFDAGASVSARDVGGRSALEVAHFFGEPDAARYLLARGACPNKRINKRGDTLLHLAARKGDIGFTVLLLENGGEPNLQNHAGQSPLYLAVRAGFEFIARELLDAGGDPGLADKKGNSPLHVAARNGDVSLVRMLLARGADADETDKNGKTSLDVAAEAGKREAAEELRKQSVPPGCEGYAIVGKTQKADERGGQHKTTELLREAKSHLKGSAFYRKQAPLMQHTELKCP